MVEELWDKQQIRECEGLFQHVQVSLSRNWTPHNQPEKEKWVSFLIGIISGGWTVCHWLMPSCTKQRTIKPVSDWLPGFVFWLLAGWTVDFLINHQEVGSLSHACAAEALSHNILLSVPFRSVRAGLESGQETSIQHWSVHRLVSLHWETVDYSGVAVVTPLRLFIDGCWNVKIMGAAETRG